eukprot:TRINITY_DN26188_c0_g1_i1.p1 TRINITY_DN26188_c0_g1~~TRINITY_DN26188_c0_g1_i1.p1  ORF type:complete len:391 (+),score=72.03 TRINITY_DN26188_c0_g1_i1:28-1173(+)
MAAHGAGMASASSSVSSVTPFGAPLGLELRDRAPATPPVRAVRPTDDDSSMPGKSKKRRLRMVHLAHAKACSQQQQQQQQQQADGAADQCEILAKSMQYLESSFDAKANMLECKVNDNSRVVNEKLDTVLNVMRTLMNQKRDDTHPIKPKAKEEPEQDLMDIVFCGSCHRLCYACECNAPCFETASCIDGDCAYTQDIYRLRLSDVEATLKLGSLPAQFALDEACTRCGIPGMTVTMNAIGPGGRVCEECVSIGRQATIIPCSAMRCSTEGFLHESCMQKFPGYPDGLGGFCDAFIDKACHANGEVPEIDAECDSDDEADPEYRCVDSFSGLSVGMPWKGGHIAEIYPGLDKFTVQYNAHGGTSIEHLSISKHVQQNSCQQ